MVIRQIYSHKKAYLDLLLLGDEQEDMIDRYLDQGELFVLETNGTAAAECVVTQVGGGIYEIKNIAVSPPYQRRGFGRALVDFLTRHYPDCAALWVGTGESPVTLDFYHALGFREFRRVKDFFLQNYDHPILEGGVQLKDMVYLKREGPASS